MNTVIKIVSVCLFLTSATVKAEGPELQVNAPSSVAMGERFRVVFTLNARPESFEAPSFDDFRVLSGPSQSTSTSTQIINNQATTTVSYSYSYILEPRQEGTYTIQPASALVEGKEYHSPDVRVEVLPPGQERQEAERDDPRQVQEPAAPGPEDIFIRVSASNSNPYRGEQVIISYRLYTRLPVTNYSIERLPGFAGLWTENLSGTQQPQASAEVVNGIRYNTVEIRRMAVFPQRSGEIRIEPVEVEMAVRMRQPSQQRPGSLFDEFFGGSSLFDRYQTIPHKVRSESLTLNVKPLPALNQPDNFSGAVGSFSMNATVSGDELNVNEAANLQISIEGKGNLRMIDTPELELPRHVEVFDPQVRDNIRNERDGVAGIREFDYLLIPRRGGSIEIPPVKFVYFDPIREEYFETSAGPFQINVFGDALQEVGLPYYRDNMQAEDIRFIKTRNLSLRPPGHVFFRSNIFFILLSLPPVLLAIFALFVLKHRKLMEDKTGLRERRAQRVARKRLIAAKRMMEQNKREKFFDEVFRALWGYVSDRLHIPAAKLSKDNVYEAFRSREVKGELANSFLEGLEECEYARFAPNGSESPMRNTYEKAMKTIITLERELRDQ